MMLSFDSVDVLIYDPVPSNRTATRSALYALGFRHTATVSTLEAFLEAVEKNPPDIALCEAQGATEELCDTIQQMRLGEAGYNPFLVIIVTAWEKTSALINKVVSSGADDLLLRPFSTALLGDRIETHIDRRKGFVITTDYVGPQRRKEADDPSNFELFEPPNSLKMKAKDRMSREAIARKLDTDLKSAREKLTREKLRRDSFQVCILWRLIQKAFAATGEASVDLAKLQALARSIEGRIKGTEFGPAAPHCESILTAAEGLTQDADRKASLQLLERAALSLHQFFHPEKSSGDQLSEIEDAVTMIRARNHSIPTLAL